MKIIICYNLKIVICYGGEKMYREYLSRLYELLAKDYNCTPQDFLREENVLTESAVIKGGRIYSGEKKFFSMVTLGGNAVVTADKALHPFLSEFIKGNKGHWLFELPKLFEINRELEKHGFTLKPSFHMQLPYKDVMPKRDYPVKWYFEREIDRFYGDKRFTHAICDRYLENCPDRIAVVALDGDEIMGMAGCSEDAPGWFQIGIDVCPQYRGKGVATYLVTLIKNEIIRRGGNPFYNSAVGNYRSMQTALSCGFKPTWMEVAAKRKDEKE